LNRDYSSLYSIWINFLQRLLHKNVSCDFNEYTLQSWLLTFLGRQTMDLSSFNLKTCWLLTVNFGLRQNVARSIHIPVCNAIGELMSRGWINAAKGSVDYFFEFPRSYVNEEYLIISLTCSNHAIFKSMQLKYVFMLNNLFE